MIPGISGNPQELQLYFSSSTSENTFEVDLVAIITLSKLAF